MEGSRARPGGEAGLAIAALGASADAATGRAGLAALVAGLGAGIKERAWPMGGRWQRMRLEGGAARTWMANASRTCPERWVLTGMSTVSRKWNWLRPDWAMV